MARVVVVGAGIAGLSAAIHAVSSGHHVVVLEKKAKIGGRGTSQNVDGYSLHYGPHLFDKAGPYYMLGLRPKMGYFSSGFQYTGRRSSIVPLIHVGLRGLRIASCR